MTRFGTGSKYISAKLTALTEPLSNIPHGNVTMEIATEEGEKGGGPAGSAGRFEIDLASVQCVCACV